MPCSFLSRSFVLVALFCLTLPHVRALQQDPPTDRCTSDGSCYFGGTCPDVTTGICQCPTNFKGTLCAEFLLGACGVTGKYPILQKESPTVKPVTCAVCDPSCYMCGGPTAQDCTECYRNSTTTNKFLQNHQCVSACSAGYYEYPQYYCEPCDQSCGACQGPNRNQCTSCNSESYYKLSVADLKQCHVICPEGYYENTSTTCAKCHTTCSECVSDNQAECFTCPTGRLLHDHQCVTGCPTGTTAREGKCASNCPAGQFTTTGGSGDCAANPCNSVCSSCTGSGVNNCITCADGNYLVLDVANSNNTCVATCPSGMWADTTNMICRNCPPNCATCTSNGRICTSCESPFKEVFGACVTNCPATYYSEAGGNVCYQCHFTCKTCTSFSQSACTSCIQSSQVPNWPYTILFNSQCLNACPASHVLVNNACVQNCASNEYAFGGFCHTCPSTINGITDNDQITAVLAGCTISLTSTADQTKVETANESTYSTVVTTLSTTDAATSSQSVVNSAANRNVGQSGEVVPATTIPETTNIVYFKREVSGIHSQTISVDNSGVAGTGATISINLPSEVNTGTRCCSANVFRQNVYTTGSAFGGFQPPAVDMRIYSNCEPGATRESISGLSTPATISFTLTGTAPSQTFRCQSWNESTNAWESTGITTVTNANTATCQTIHFTTFTLREVTPGTTGAVTFSIAGDFITQLFPILVALAFLIMGGVAVAFDCYGRKGENDKFPHRAHPGRFRKCLTIYRYTLLYNMPFLNIYGYFHLVVWCLYKTLWLSFIVWLMLIIEVSIFKEDVGSSSETTMVLTALLCGLLLIPNSFTHWILIKKLKVKARYDAQASERTLKNIMPDASQPIEVDYMSDREIKLFDRKNPGKPSLPKVQEEVPSTMRGFTFQDQEILSWCGVLIIVLFTALAWGVGFGLTLVFGSDINERNGDHYVRFVGCFLLSILFGLVYSLIKLALATCCVSYFKKGRGSRCRICFFIDKLTWLIFEDFDTNNIKDPKKRNNRIGIEKQNSGVKKPAPRSQAKPSSSRSNVKVDLSARV